MNSSNDFFNNSSVYMNDTICMNIFKCSTYLDDTDKPACIEVRFHIFIGGSIVIFGILVNLVSLFYLIFIKKYQTKNPNINYQWINKKLYLLLINLFITNILLLINFIMCGILRFSELFNSSHYVVVFTMLFDICQTVGLLNISAIAFYRSRAICKEIYNTRSSYKCISWRFLIIVWLFGFISNCVILIPFYSTEHGFKFKSLTLRKIMQFSTSLINGIIPIIIVLLTTIKIMYYLERHSKTLVKYLNTRMISKYRTKNPFKMLVLIMLTIILLNIPNILVLSLDLSESASYCQCPSIGKIWYRLFQLSFYTNALRASIDPIIYTSLATKKMIKFHQVTSFFRRQSDWILLKLSLIYFPSKTINSVFIPDE